MSSGIFSMPHHQPLRQMVVSYALRMQAFVLKCAPSRIAMYAMHSTQKSTNLWKNANVVESNTKQGFFNIVMDEKSVLKSPSGQPLLVPSYELGIIMLLEWGDCGKNGLKIMKKPLTNLLQRANVYLENLEEREACIKKCTTFLPTDTILYWNETDEKLFAAQKSQWKPVIETANKTFNSTLQPTTSLSIIDVKRCGATKMLENLHNMSVWKLAAFEMVSKITKSFTLSLLMAAGKIAPVEALNLSLLEQKHQTEKWGEIKAEHSLQYTDLKRLVLLGNLLMHSKNIQ